ncbi:uncharacterized protein METZ01_LOCUS515205, partial [marine metagenome]
CCGICVPAGLSRKTTCFPSTVSCSAGKRLRTDCIS